MGILKNSTTVNPARGGFGHYWWFHVLFWRFYGREMADFGENFDYKLHVLKFLIVDVSGNRELGILENLMTSKHTR